MCPLRSWRWELANTNAGAVPLDFSELGLGFRVEGSVRRMLTIIAVIMRRVHAPPQNGGFDRVAGYSGKKM